MDKEMKPGGGGGASAQSSPFVANAARLNERIRAILADPRNVNVAEAIMACIDDFLEQGGIAATFGELLGNAVGRNRFPEYLNAPEGPAFIKDLLALPFVAIRLYKDGECGKYHIPRSAGQRRLLS